MAFGDVLKELLEKEDITQKILANDLNIAASTLGNYIHNNRQPDFETLKKLAAYFHVSIDYLLEFHSDNIKQLTHEEEILLYIFRELTPEQKKVCTDLFKLLHKK